MPSALTPQQVLPAPAPLPNSQPLDLNEIQGDVLIGLQKLFERFIFFQINNVAAFKLALRTSIVERVTTSLVVQLREFQLRDYKSQGHTQPLPAVGLNLAFSSGGIQKLVPNSNLGDPSFASGAQAQASNLHDPQGLTTWLAPFLSGKIDGVFFVTGGTQAAVDAEAATVLSALGASVATVFDQTANTRPGAEHGHEHFGWQDGISQPGINGLQDMLNPGLFVFGYPGLSGNVAAPPQPWMTNGSFMVFRRLQQLVPEFEQFLSTEGQALGLDPVLLGARIVGRWKSGAPLVNTPAQDDTSVAADPQRNNDFDFSDDQAQRRCPFGAHIRKTNPRADLVRANLDPRRIIRAGIPYGPEVSPAEAAAHKTQQDRGLMFVCYQTSIANQFEFVQSSWANNPQFVSPIFAKARPSGGGSVTVGIDPIIGQAAGAAGSAARARTTDEPVPNYPTGNHPHAEPGPGFCGTDGRGVLLCSLDFRDHQHALRLIASQYNTQREVSCPGPGKH